MSTQSLGSLMVSSTLLLVCVICIIGILISWQISDLRRELKSDDH